MALLCSGRNLCPAAVFVVGGWLCGLVSPTGKGRGLMLAWFFWWVCSWPSLARRFSYCVARLSFDQSTNVCFSA
ncbi:hypothetical protein BRADI_1g61805v3 [Brachypodium distachyon]|uniref:Uncharacterized protein n=1 Tax=Brachypodium distachyon TaxID=15368 RepID=A0A2K2DSX7_BRADI|nr:hypothetical protein BRADI_1g61805v3 [Brachypodium distachyon]